MNDAAPPTGLSTGMAKSLMVEIARKLEHLARTGEPGAIDLRSLPMTARDREELDELLGRGDVEATLHVAGESEIRETRYAGVWWVRHGGSGGHTAAELIEITLVPDILAAHPDDIADAAASIAAETALRTEEETAHA